jgi:hypothetical protein
MLIRFFARRATNPQPNLIMTFLGTVADMLHHKMLYFSKALPKGDVAWTKIKDSASSTVTLGPEFNWPAQGSSYKTNVVEGGSFEYR